MNPYLMEVMLQERKKEMLAEAERIQQLAAYEANRPTMTSRILSSLGKMLISAGLKLTRRYSHGEELHAG